MDSHELFIGRISMKRHGFELGRGVGLTAVSAFTIAISSQARSKGCRLPKEVISAPAAVKMVVRPAAT